MNISKDHQPKRRFTGSNPQFHLKNMPFLAPHPTTPHHNKGKVRIEQYQYDEENKLGEGFTSKVYLGRRIDDPNSQFAIKVVDKRKLGKIKQNLELLKQEMAIHKQLDHPNIVKCHEIIEKTNFYYFVLQYCSHGTLDTFIKKHEKLTETTAIGIIEQVMAGYKYLMKQKVLHRDLKPPNILKSGPNWKIADFGFSVIGKKSLLGEINVGTPAYMAPEALERTYYSPKTDFFALGVLCYEMLFGVTPWQHKNQKMLLQLIKQTKIKQEQLECLKNANLALFIKSCCESNQRKRMSQQQFENFSFWKESKKEESQQPLPLNQTNKPKNSGFCDLLSIDKLGVKDDPSTCYSKTSKASNSTSTIGLSLSSKKVSSQFLLQGNTAVLQRELYYATVIYILLKNNSCLLFEQSEEKELFMCLLSKHAGYIIRRIKHSKVNYLCLKKWQEYCLTEAYLNLAGEATDIQNRVLEITSAEIKRRSIAIIRQINSKFDELTYDKHLSLATVNNLKAYLVQVMKRLILRHESLDVSSKENILTIKVLEYLMKYFKYLGEVTATTEQSRAIAIKREFKDRSQLQEDFGLSKTCLEQFECLKQQITAIRI